ncbi:protein translocase component YidC [Actinoplanes sp. ATCC 53533]|uniref:membrane protein insertase YidC n=1 Tax=Actinoplanes sp. ATCC 53533 TaxID=1288362 RepID=UPI000F78518F|nr:membrane protein insertase YidC [Actinoplanes sp. ATCC 53533]RSM47694.1 protein translocase component YidC [Actinoplanes sp. ATCC 53533]
MSISAALDAVVGVAHSALEGLATLLTPAAGGLAAALAIVLLTVAVRLLISPLTWLQARSAKRGAALAPQLAALRERHRDDPVLLATETLALQRANGAGPFAAMLPALAQAPFFMLMYHLVQPGPGAPAGVLSGQLGGVPLTAHLAAGLPVFAVLLAVAVALAWWSSRRTRLLLAATGTPADPAQPGATLLPRIMAMLPFLTVVMVAWLPLAGGLYLVTSAAWTALEQAIWRRPPAVANR